MLIRSRFKRGECQLKKFNPKIRRGHRRKKMANEDYREEYEKAFHKDFSQMVNNVENLFAYY